ncbi:MULTISPECIES: hypothetical protein [Acidobacteriaceae]|uniref:hypothetical protein n=1 Tax=Acidobacteriaceae TaxID=204434 RepID=UPI00131D68A7|nr:MULTISPECIES: hypothetical protein [Acidobacteriaceae]MDW5266597.1 hypothetical protein [Edaphobacter sp.]
MIKLFRSYLFWTYERGSFHYDVMVTLILLFLFVGPRFIDFKAKPVETITLDPSEVMVKEAGTTEAGKIFVYQIRAQDLAGATTDSERQAAILNVIDPISGHVTLRRYEPIRDAKGKIVSYNAWVLR